MLQNITTGIVIAEKLAVADTFGSRFRGLMGRRELPPGEGLLIVPCNCIHTFFMRFSIDVMFIDKDCGVLHLIRALRPYRFSTPVQGARAVVELPVGVINHSRTKVGDRLCIAVPPMYTV